MSIKDELLAIVQRSCALAEPPPVQRVFMPEPVASPERNSEFGVVALEDGAAGLYYAWLGDAQKGMNARYAADEFAGRSPLEMVRYFESPDEADRSLGLAAINAITQSAFRRAGLELGDAPDSMAALDIAADDHLGMVGYFPSLVERLRQREVRVTVIERKRQFVGRSACVEVTLDAQRLRACNKVLATASTLLNDTIDEILDITRDADVRALIGPTAGFFPDPLFSRGVAAVGGTRIVNVDAAIERLRANQKFGSSAQKYLITRTAYPGADALMAT